jgi:hypothetical protein
VRVGILITLAFALAGCAGEQATTGTTMVRPGAPPEPMAGRWVLASGPSQCGMNFRGTPEAPEGTIAPEGGCPGKFFTSRKWTFDSNGLSIRDHNSEPLAQLSAAGGVRFDGKATTGDPVTLTR